MEGLERLIKENVEYDIIACDDPFSVDTVNEMVQLIVELLAFSKDSVVVGGVEYPYKFVSEKLLKLKRSHILYVLHSLEEAAPKITNLKSYLLKCLINAPMTINTYYLTRVRNDMHTSSTL